MLNIESMVTPQYDSNQYICDFNPSGNKAHDEFLKACRNGNISKVKRYIKAGNSLDIADDGGRTPLMLAAISSNDLVFSLVFKQTPMEKMDAKDRVGHNVLHYACKSEIFSRVQMLYARNVPLVGGLRNVYAAEHTQNTEINALIGPECMRLLSIDNLILADCGRKHNGDLKKIQEEMFRRTGKHVGTGKSYLEGLDSTTRMMRVSQAPIQVCKLTQEEQQKVANDVYASPETDKEIKQNLSDAPVRNVSEAANRLEDKFGWRPTKEEVTVILQRNDIKTQHDVLKDKQTLKSIAKHFKSNPPESLEDAIEYVKVTYGYTCKDKMMLNFLKWCGINVS